jgi:hypothetical protein
MTDVQLMLIEKWVHDTIRPVAGSIWCEGDDIGDELRAHVQALLDEVHRLRKDHQ